MPMPQFKFNSFFTRLLYFDENFENNGVTAIALYDYQAAADDEISFDPSDIITNIEMVSDLHKIGANRNQGLILIYSFRYQLQSSPTC